MTKQVRPVRYDNGESRELNSNEIIAPDYLGTETRDGTKFLRDDGTWQNVSGGSGIPGGSSGDIQYNNAGSFGGLNTATYPTIAELAYVKGVTSAIQTQLNGKQNTITNPITGTGTNNELAAFNSGTSITSLPLATYPSLTELSYVKGVTSAIQTQLNGKQATLTNPVTGTGTNNEIAAFNSTGSTITSLTTATYPSLTELSYVKGVTSALQTQLNNLQPLDADLTALAALTGTNNIYYRSAANTWSSVTIGNALAFSSGTLSGLGYTLIANAPSLNPADSTTYYFGTPYTVTTGTVAANRRVYIPKAGTIKSIYLFGTCTTGTNESVSFYLRLNNTTDTTISTTVDMSASPFIANVTGLSITVVAGDYFEIKEITPAWATNPTAQLVNVIVYIE